LVKKKIKKKKKKKKENLKYYIYNPFINIKSNNINNNVTIVNQQIEFLVSK